MCASAGKTVDLGGGRKFNAGDKVVITDGENNRFGGPIKDDDMIDGVTVHTVVGYESWSGTTGVVVSQDGAHTSWYVDEDRLSYADLPVGTAVTINDPEGNKSGGPISSRALGKVYQVKPSDSYFPNAFRVGDGYDNWVVDKSNVTVVHAPEADTIRPFEIGDKVIVTNGAGYVLTTTGAYGLVEEEPVHDEVKVRFVRASLSEPDYGPPEGTSFWVDTDVLAHYDGDVEYENDEADDEVDEDSTFAIGDKVVVTSASRADEIDVTPHVTVGEVIADKDFDDDYKVYFEDKADWEYVNEDFLARVPDEPVVTLVDTPSPSAAHLIADMEVMIAKHGIDRVDAALRFFRSL